MVVEGGRGSAKSFHVALAVLNITYEPGETILYTRYTMTSAKDSIIPEFLEKLQMLDKEEDFEITNNDILNKRTGSRILFRGIKTSSGNQTAKLKSIPGLTMLVVEEGEEADNGDDFDTIDNSVRNAKKDNRVWIVMNPAHKTHYFYKEFIAPQRNDTTVIHTDYRINKRNLSPSILAKIERTKEVNPLRYRHVYLGEWLDDAQGILWNRQILERQRIEKAPELERTIIAIDPATTATMESDETGIVALGKAGKNGYLLADRSGRYSPNQWSAAALELAREVGATTIVAEKNQGGDMVKSVLDQSAKGTMRIKLVNATKGKAVRAEPVYGLYEQGNVYHVGYFPELERQQVTFNPEANTESPDRVDALVWGFTELIVKAKFAKFEIA